MRSLFTLSFATLAVLAMTASARADGMCLVSSMDHEAPALSPLFIDGPQSQAAEGEDAASRPIDLIWSDVNSWGSRFVRMEARVDQGQHEPQDTGILWCTASDQDQCVPALPTPTAPELLSPPPAMQHSMPRPDRARFVRDVARPTGSEAGPDGFRDSLLRPPRG